MEENRTETAIKRIESALARIAEAADAVAASPAAPADPAQVPPSVSQLVVQHEALREEVARQISKLDEVLGKLDP